MSVRLAATQALVRPEAGCPRDGVVFFDEPTSAGLLCLEAFAFDFAFDGMPGHWRLGEFGRFGGAQHPGHVIKAKQLRGGAQPTTVSFMSSCASQSNLGRAFGVAVTRQTRTSSHVLHITETVRGQRWIESKFGRALCAVPVDNLTERGTPEDATCGKCIRKYRKLTEGGSDD